MKTLGYKLKCTDAYEIAAVFGAIKANIAIAAQSEYHRLLSAEIEAKVEGMMLGITRDEPASIFEAAQMSLNERIDKTEKMGANTEYNLTANALVYYDKEYAYIMPFISNAAIFKVFTDTEGLEDYCVDYDDASDIAEMQRRAHKWEELYSSEKRRPPCSMALTNSNIQFNKNQLKFQSRPRLIRHAAEAHVFNRCLSMYSCGGNIAPEMQYAMIAAAFEKAFNSKEGKEEIAKIKERLVDYPEITLAYLGLEEPDKNDLKK